MNDRVCVFVAPKSSVQYYNDVSLVHSFDENDTLDDNGNRIERRTSPNQTD